MCFVSVQGEHFKNAYKLLNLEAHIFHLSNKRHIVQCMGKIFLGNFKGHLSNTTQNNFLILETILFLCNVENLRALRFKSSDMFLKCPLFDPPQLRYDGLCTV